MLHAKNNVFYIIYVCIIKHSYFSIKLLLYTTTTTTITYFTYHTNKCIFI